MAQRIRRASVVVIDASALYALVDSRDPEHERCRSTIESLEGVRIVVPALALVEADYLIVDRLGIDAEIALLRDVDRGAYRLAPFESDDVATCISLIERYRNLEIGLADASTVVVADRLQTRRVFTLDRRHFETMRPLSGGRFDLLPD